MPEVSSHGIPKAPIDLMPQNMEWEGIVLAQLDAGGEEHTIVVVYMHLSWKLLPREERYSTIGNECPTVKVERHLCLESTH